MKSGMRTPMNNPTRHCRFIVTLACGLTCFSSAFAAVSQVPAQLPLFLNNSVPPLNMLVVGRDHKLFFPAYNDASDLDGDGSIDIRYKPSITYLGYFDSNTCYTYTGSYFTAFDATTDKTCRTHTGRWSGDYLNYLTTSRADALRKVLYGGYREVDTTSQTILTRAYIPMDAHTWGKEYTSLAVDGYNLSDYTPLSNPSAGNYTLFANNTPGSVPMLRVLANQANIRIFGWTSREVTQGGTRATNTSLNDVDVSPTDYQVRVEVCKSSYIESNCKQYPNGNYKPTGILHDYGEGNQMYFGLLTGTYQNNIQGGALRKAISSFSGEVDASTGIFGTRQTNGTYVKSGIIGTLDGLRLSTTSCNIYTTPMPNANCPNWGNPLGEMMYETMRYFSGETTPSANYKSGLADTTGGLSLGSVTTWTNPYSATPNATANPPTYPSCSKPFETLFSDVNPSYDSDLPGSTYTISASPGSSNALSALDVSGLGKTIWDTDVTGTKNINIGQTLTSNDGAPTAKVASSLGNIRGLPEEPTKEGTFNAAAVAYFANTNPITTPGNQRVQTFSMALSSTLPRIQIPIGTGSITLVPFGKVAASGITEQITGFYIDSLYNMPGQPSNANINGGRAQAVFRVVFDDCGQGCDYDMDAIVLYTVAVNSLGTLDVTLKTDYAVSGAESHMGYTISGTTNDGIYLEVTGGANGNLHYSLDTPGTRLPGACAASSNPCNNTNDLLPGKYGNNQSFATSRGDTHTRRFVASPTTSITNLQDPLWYAAKWGGFGDSKNTSSSLPVAGQWDSNKSGTPNNYFLVSNASKLKAQLDLAFSQIVQTNNSVSTPAVVPVKGTSNSASTYLNSLTAGTWSGDLIKNTTVVDAYTGVSTTTRNWSASAQMPTWTNRNITMATQAGNGLQNFTYANLSNRTYASVNLQTTLTSDQVDFIKGDTSNATSQFRRRTSLIGDLVNSAPAVVDVASFKSSALADALNGSSGDYAAFQSTQLSRRGQVYVGANDGMLHGFDTDTGVEKFAFIPSAVISNLSVLTNRNYNTNAALHRYFVDGTPVVSDVYFSGAWHTILVGTLGAGGNEIFALDVTNPDSIKLLWEFTSQTDSDLGATLSTPVITKLHSGEWAVIVGNGYNGNNGYASLLILNAATGATISKLKTSVEGNNGLSSPVVLDANSDGIADYVYAGDLQGNLWRFDLIAPGSLTSSTTASSYKVAFGNRPLYTATTTDTNGAVQSITAPPDIVSHPSSSGVLVLFGTGRYFTSADKSSTDLQTLYGIWDKQVDAQTASSTPVLNRASLQQQTITLQANNVDFSGTSNDVRIVSANAVDWTAKSGWYLDLAVGTALLGERLVDPLVVSGSVLFASTRTPVTDVCSPGVTGWEYGLDPTTGGRTSFTVFNLRRNGTISSADNYNNTVVSGMSTSGGGIAISSLNGQKDTTDSSGEVTPVNTGTKYDGRQNWRVIPSP